MPTMKNLLFAIILSCILQIHVRAQTPCNFSGPAIEQSLCLLRPVKKYGNLANPLTVLPIPLDQLVGHPINITKKAFREYLQTNNIREIDLGGNLDEPLSKTLAGETVQYFIIHDTSTPILPPLKPFPDNINQSGWNGNNLIKYEKNAHVFINRLGESTTKVNFKERKLTTKYETKNRHAREGLFLGVELVQPRRIDARNSDAEAPMPGFTEVQLKRLALVYIAASLRKGVWLIPAYHAAIDAGIPNAHDDPQNFDLNAWVKTLDDILRIIKSEFTH